MCKVSETICQNWPIFRWKKLSVSISHKTSASMNRAWGEILKRLHNHSTQFDIKCDIMKDNYFRNNLLKLVYFPMKEIVNEHFSQNVCFDEPGLKRNFGKITKSQWSTYLTLYVTSWKIIIYINFVQNFRNNLSKLVYFPKFSDERNCQ